MEETPNLVTIASVWSRYSRENRARTSFMSSMYSWSVDCTSNRDGTPTRCGDRQGGTHGPLMTAIVHRIDHPFRLRPTVNVVRRCSAKWDAFCRLSQRSRSCNSGCVAQSSGGVLTAVFDTCGRLYYQVEGSVAALPRLATRNCDKHLVQNP